MKLLIDYTYMIGSLKEYGHFDLFMCNVKHIRHRIEQILTHWRLGLGRKWLASPSGLVCMECLHQKNKQDKKPLLEPTKAIRAVEIFLSYSHLECLPA